MNNARRLGFTMTVLIGLMALLLTGCGLLEQEATLQPVADIEANLEITPVEQVQLDQPVAAQTSPTTQTQPPVAVPTVPAAVPVAQLDSAAVLAAQEQALIALYQRVNPAIVSVNLQLGGGSGFVIDSDGYIVTNNHVIEAGGPIVIGFSNGDRLEAEVVGADSQADIALLKVEAEPGTLTAVALGDSDSLQVGQIVIAIGSPFGLDNTMTSGIVSGLSRALPTNELATGGGYQVPDVIQTDAAINPGNSGGPLLNLAGEVIGVNTAIESPVRANSGVGFAVPANVVNVVVQQLRDNGRVNYPWLGISGGTLRPEAAEAMGLDRNLRGVLISTVVAGGPADSAGLRGGDEATGLGGDVVTSIDGRILSEFDDLLGYIVQQTRVGQTVELTVIRDNQETTLSLTLGARPDEPEIQPAP